MARDSSRANTALPAGVRAREERIWRQRNYTDDEHDPKRPIAWIPRGGIMRPVYEQSEVA